jgi:hypothetical protein
MLIASAHVLLFLTAGLALALRYLAQLVRQQFIDASNASDLAWLMAEGPQMQARLRRVKTSRLNLPCTLSAARAFIARFGVSSIILSDYEH